MLCFLPLLSLLGTAHSALNTAAFQQYLHASGRDLLTISRPETAARFRLFTERSRFVDAQNAAGLTYTSELNKFSVMTEAERASYLGANRTLFGAPAESEPVIPVGEPPASVSWIDQGHVTQIKDQGKCGSCWTYGPAVAIEGAYKKMTGKLKEFSNQELLDCAYTDKYERYNGCNGGFETQAFSYLQKKQRLALLAEYPYEPRNKDCRSAGKGNGFKAAKMLTYTQNDGTEASTIVRLAQGPLSVAFDAKSSIFQYKIGLYRTSRCSLTANHAVAAVAYTPTYIMIKNSWGTDFGDRGLVKFARNWDGCGIHQADNNFLATMQLTGGQDDDAEAAPLEWKENPNRCFDVQSHCMTFYCKTFSNYKHDCRKTCGYCK